MGDRLEQLHDDITTLLGQYMADSTPSVRVLDEAIRHALASLQGMLPPAEVTATIQTASQEQDLSSLLPDLMGVNWIIYPWEETGSNRQRGYPFTNVTRTKVRITYAQPQVGEKMRVSYRRRYTLAGLDRATVDTLPAEFDRALTLAAVAEILTVQATMLYIQDPKSNAAINRGLREIADELKEQALHAVYDQVPYQNPVWDGAGL
jgi:hypothetical protein